ncbi:MAG: hypothetical protein KJ714_10295, partial [Euryarchaeota archaeon]|nr:hypothetical protein [Euryarchaeota archaeon]
MIRHEFREEKSSLGKVLRPVAEVVLKRGGFSVGMPMYIDSGDIIFAAGSFHRKVSDDINLIKDDIKSI